MNDFAIKLQPSLLNIEDKNRSNLFAWRGQFSPQLIEHLLDAYCQPGSVVLDPFAGSGTVLYEAAAMSLPAYGFEINPAAWCFSKLYELNRDHPLLGPWQPSRDCHIEPDWILIYTAENDSLRLERTGTHSDLFKK